MPVAFCRNHRSVQSAVVAPPGQGRALPAEAPGFGPGAAAELSVTTTAAFLGFAAVWVRLPRPKAANDCRHLTH